MSSQSSKLRVGDWVEVRSKSEILSTLDADGRLDGMPFMPEMFAFCGKRFQVYKRAHKTCDTVFPVRGRRVNNAVHLQTRCDGSAHGGCQASCLLFWKDAWLKPVSNKSTNGAGHDEPNDDQADGARDNPPSASVGGVEAVVWAKTQSPDATSGAPLYVCQATRLPYATTSLEWWDIRQYIEDYTSGNVGLWRIVCGAAYFLFQGLSRSPRGAGFLQRLYDRFYPLWRGYPFPRKHGTIPEGEATPVGTLDLQPGELVRIRPYQEILETLNTRDRNRGLYFDAEEVPYCGGEHRVLKRVTRIIHEKTGKMLEMKTPSLILDSVICESRYSECRLFCPRSIYSYWREIWVERVEPKSTGPGQGIAEPVASHCEPASSGR
jgi:hypothetical protein